MKAIPRDRFYEIVRTLVPLDTYAFFLRRHLKTIAEANGLSFLAPSLLIRGGLLPESSTLTCEIKDSPDCEVDSISGSGDDFGEKDALNYATLETVERLFFHHSKNLDQLTTGLRFEGGEVCKHDSNPCKILSSSGFALESTPIRAMEAALLEAVERDAFLFHWYSESPPKELIEAPTELGMLWIQAAKQRGLTCRIYSLESILTDVHVIYVTVHNPKLENGYTGFCSGLSASTSLAQASEKAFRELDRFVGIFDICLRTGSFPVADISTPMGRFSLYQNPTLFEELRVFTGPGIPVLPEKPPAESKIKDRKTRLSDWADRIGPGSLWYTPTNFKRLKIPVFCAYFTSPNLFQLHYNQKSHAIGTLGPAAARLGSRTSARDAPHPLP